MEKHPDDKELQRITMGEINHKSRDNARTPMQWDNTAHAGFSSTTPWQRENESYTTINAESQVGVPGSVFSYWVAILALRKEHKDIFIYGNFEMVDAENEYVFAYTRAYGRKKVIVVVNFTSENHNWKLPDNVRWKREDLLVSVYGGVMEMDNVVSLRPFEAFASFVS